MASFAGRELKTSCADRAAGDGTHGAAGRRDSATIPKSSEARRQTKDKSDRSRATGEAALYPFRPKQVNSKNLLNRYPRALSDLPPRGAQCNRA